MHTIPRWGVMALIVTGFQLIPKHIATVWIPYLGAINFLGVDDLTTRVGGLLQK